MSNHSYTGLYYPFIHFKDERWLKLSALYWDGMGRIVPPGYAPADGKDVIELGDYVKTYRPDRVDARFGETFIDFVAKHAEALRERYSVDQVDRWPPVPAAAQPPPAGGRSGSDPRMGHVFYEKLRDDLRKALIDSGIAAPDPWDPQWIGMHPRLAQVYMTALADQLAGEHGLLPLTDETVDHMAVGGLSVERLAQVLLGDVELVSSEKSAVESESVAAYFAIETVIPADIDQLSIREIRSFRDKYPQERASFQKALAAFAKDHEWLRKINDEEALEDRLKAEYEKELKPQVERLRDKLKSMNIGTAASALTMQVSTPALVTMTSDALGAGKNPFVLVGGAVAGAALGLLPIVRDRRKVREELKTSPLAYMLRLEKDLKPRTVLGWVGDLARRFRFRR